MDVVKRAMVQYSREFRDLEIFLFPEVMHISA